MTDVATEKIIWLSSRMTFAIKYVVAPLCVLSGFLLSVPMIYSHVNGIPSPDGVLSESEMLLLLLGVALFSSFIFVATIGSLKKVGTTSNGGIRYIVVSNYLKQIFITSNSVKVVHGFAWGLGSLVIIELKHKSIFGKWIVFVPRSSFKRSRGNQASPIKRLTEFLSESQASQGK